jgi:hypothetical protein
VVLEEEKLDIAAACLTSSFVPCDPCFPFESLHLITISIHIIALITSFLDSLNELFLLRLLVYFYLKSFQPFQQDVNYFARSILFLEHSNQELYQHFKAPCQQDANYFVRSILFLEHSNLELN